MSVDERLLTLFCCCLLVVPSCGGSGSEETPPCVPSCEDRSCGDDGCGGSCGDCEEGFHCDDTFTCVADEPCVPACDGRDCGDDGCGGECGTCAEDQSCNPYIGRCVGGCVPLCGEDRVCGDDGCEGSCGTCSEDKTCAAGKCVAPFSCSDGIQNGPETDRDCGGSCPACAVGQHCTVPLDCTSSACESGTCVAGPGCSDGAKNGKETDVDCGGGDCERCPIAKNCKGHADCLSETCIYGICEKPTCQDGVKNQGEADTDCGGPCGLCGDGRACGKDGDCASGKCEAFVCISCKDGKRNGTETDVDCGGGACLPCPDGKKCASGKDCGGGGCEGGICCGKNACGYCGPAPAEVCNGKDDDCDGKTDEGLLNACGTCGTVPKETCNGKDDDCDGQTDEAPEIGEPQPCENQKGVCAGAKTRCAGASGWVCDASALSAHSGDWEADESRCDDKDNDCDGETDEGLRNACGTCGNAPQEWCNGLDDDCNGKIDDRPECDACLAVPAVVALDKTSPSYGYYRSPGDGMAVVGTDAFVMYRMQEGATNRLWKLSDGKTAVNLPLQIPSEPKPSEPVGIPSLAAADGKLHAVVSVDHVITWPTVYYYENRYYRLGLDGKTEKETFVSYSGKTFGQPSAIAIRDGKLGVGCVHDTAKAMLWYEQVPETGAFTTGKIVANEPDTSTWVQVRYDSKGSAWAVMRTGAFPSRVWIREVAKEYSDFEVATDAYHPGFRIATFDTFHVVYEVKGVIWHRARKTGAWSDPVQVSTGRFPVVVLGRDEQVQVYGIDGDTSLWVATSTDGKTWNRTDVFSVSGTVTLSGPQAVVDFLGRRHVTVVRTDPGSKLAETVYLMHCEGK